MTTHTHTLPRPVGHLHMRALAVLCSTLPVFAWAQAPAPSTVLTPSFGGIRKAESAPASASAAAPKLASPQPAQGAKTAKAKRHKSRPGAHSKRHRKLSASAAKAAQAPAAAEPSQRFVLKKNESLSTFSETWLTTSKTWPEIAKLNRLKNPHRISEGQEIIVPLRYLRVEQHPAAVVNASGDTSLAVGAKLSQGQQIKTGANSSAVIELADQSRVKLLPGSVAELVRNGSYAARGSEKAISNTWYSGVLRLVQGQVEVLATKRQRLEDLKILMPTSVVGVRGTVFRVGLMDKNRSKTEVVEGAVSAENTTQNSSATVSAGFGVVIDPTAKELKPAALLPAPDLSALPSELKRPTVSASFPALAGAVSYRIQIAKDAAFNEIVADLPSPTPSVSFNGLADGAWHLRARGVDAQGLEGADRATRLSLLPAPPPPPPPPPPPAAPPPLPRVINAEDTVTPDPVPAAAPRATPSPAATSPAAQSSALTPLPAASTPGHTR